MYRLHSNYSLPAPNSEAKEYYFTKIIAALYYSSEIVIRKLKLNSFNDFGEQCHTKNSEPYFYESSYLYDNSDSQLDSRIAIPVDTRHLLCSKDCFVY